MFPTLTEQQLERWMPGIWREVAPLLRVVEPVWTPQPGPQAAAYECQADVIGYGGAAGGGKTDLLIGKAGTQHRRSIIFRRVFPSVRGAIERSREIFNARGDSHARDSFNEQLHIWRLLDGRLSEFGQLQYEKDKYKHKGIPRDFIGFDEATEFTESQVRFVMGWNRSTSPGQKCQTMLTFNPPLDEAGTWVLRFFAPWLDEQHSRPAKDGELRWFAMVDGKEIETRPEPFEHEGETVTPKSRTFFYADLEDNPILAETGYGATIDALPEPLRSLLKGNFHAARIADPWQTIPVAWVKIAQSRWEETPPEGAILTAVGCDPARGGDDEMAISPLWDNWFAPLLTYPGTAVPDGPTAAALLIDYLTAGVLVGMDVIGIGSSVYDSAQAMDGARVLPINNSEGVRDLRDKSGRLKFRNVRAASYWAMREALDPTHGDDLALPPDPELLADLCAPRYKVTAAGIQLEDKEDLKSRLGRSPNKGDAAVMAHWVSRIPTGADLIAF